MKINTKMFLIMQKQQPIVQAHKLAKCLLRERSESIIISPSLPWTRRGQAPICELSRGSENGGRKEALKMQESMISSTWTHSLWGSRDSHRLMTRTAPASMMLTHISTLQRKPPHLQNFYFLQILLRALASVAQRVGLSSVHQKVAGLIPRRGTYLGCGSDPRLGHVREATDGCFTLTWMFPFLFLTLKSVKHVFW